MRAGEEDRHSREGGEEVNLYLFVEGQVKDGDQHAATREMTRGGSFELFESQPLPLESLVSEHFLIRLMTS